MRRSTVMSRALSSFPWELIMSVSLSMRMVGSTSTSRTTRPVTMQRSVRRVCVLPPRETAAAVAGRLINATLLVLLGVLFNSVFPWRRYPRHHQTESAPQAGVGEQDIAAAMSRLDTFVDMSPEELLRVYQQAEQLAAQRRTSATVVRFPRRRQPTAINSDSQSDGNARRESR